MSAKGIPPRNRRHALMPVRQRHGNDCGPAALATVAAAYGHRLDYRGLLDDAALDCRGTDLLTLARIAQRYGFGVRAVRADHGAISECPLPAIAHLRRRLGGGHFVVLLTCDADFMTVADPAVGVRRLSRTKYQRWSTGYLLLAEPSVREPSVRPGPGVTAKSTEPERNWVVPLRSSPPISGPSMNGGPHRY